MTEKILKEISTSLKIIEKAASEYLKRLPPRQYVDMKGRQWTEVTVTAPMSKIKTTTGEAS